MGRHSAPRRPTAISVLGTSAGALSIAALVALLDTAVAGSSGGGTALASAARSADAVETETPWVAGPLEMPTIGVVAPDRGCGVRLWQSAVLDRTTRDRRGSS